MFHPRSKKYPYTEYTDQHYLVVKKNNGLVFDADYPYFDNSFKLRTAKFWVRVLMYILIWPILCFFMMGLKVKGRKKLKFYKDQLKDGAVTISNHIHLWDFIANMKALRPYKPYVLIWDMNIRGENGAMMRAVNGVPIPSDNKEGMRAMNEAVGKHLENGGWLHVYAEGSMWEYYPYIRPFKLGAFSLACRYNKPVLPLGFSFRKPSWIRKHIFKQDAAITVTVGEPIYKNDSLPEAEQRIDLATRVHEAICKLSNLDDGENLYPPIFDRNKRAENDM